MKLVFLPSTRDDLAWMRNYYTRAFPEGARQAAAQYARTRNLLRQNPLIGHPVEGIEGIREYSIPSMPFSFIYRVMKDRVEILRVGTSGATAGDLAEGISPPLYSAAGPGGEGTP